MIAKCQRCGIDAVLTDHGNCGECAREYADAPPYLERLRDEFALAAMAGLASRIGTDSSISQSWVSSWAYCLADAALAARGRK